MFHYQILIPAYNAQSCLPELLESIYQLDEKPQNVIVVDDGSADATSEIAKQNKVELIQNKKNKGKGFSLRRGFRFFLDQNGSDYLLCMDADLQHPVSAIPDFIQFAKENNSRIVIGNRKKKISEMPLLRVLSNRITSAILGLFTRQDIKDSQCGMRLIHQDVLRSIELYENGFIFESEFILEAARKKIPIQFIDIPTIYNQENSNISHILDTFRFIRLILKEMVR